eukprot:COSAG03_NODE_22631_length_288_cov_1.698413_2_plen_31_part_01
MPMQEGLPHSRQWYQNEFPNLPRYMIEMALD